MKLHCSQTKLGVMIYMTEFEFPMKLHCSQTCAYCHCGKIGFEFPMKLHCSQTPNQNSGQNSPVTAGSVISGTKLPDYTKSFIDNNAVFINQTLMFTVFNHNYIVTVAQDGVNEFFAFFIIDVRTKI